MKIERLLKIVFILLNCDQISANDLANKVGVSKRTIYRDVESLSLANIPIYTTLGKSGGISILSSFKLDRALFSKKEKQYILNSIESFNTINTFKMDNTINKLKAIFKEASISPIEIDFSTWAQENENLDFNNLKEAITNREELEIKYYSSYNGVSNRIIKPMKLLFKNKSWYLYSYCTLRESYRLFKINRIISINKTGNNFFEEKLDYNIKLNKVDENKLIPLKLHFSNKISYRALDEFNHKDIVINKDNSISLDTKIIYDEWIISFLASLGKDVTIISPDFLKKELVSFIKKIEENLNADRQLSS
ncbi:MAG: YafY family protein [Sphaerochaetaceae bacterium]|nr:YafY family protein [Sphaerochaetaceae bacterium]